MSKNYRSDVRSDSDADNLPEVAVFEVDEALAKEIVRLAALVAANKLYQVQQFDYRVDYFRFSDPEDASTEEEREPMRTDADILHVSETQFWFSATLKHSSIDVRTERLSISELMESFNLTPASSKVDDESKKFVRQVAGLDMWDYDNKAGVPYQECDRPSEGFLDSHCCLMGLIEQARELGGE